MSLLALGIETSCDETSVALVDDRGRIHANVIASQSGLHARWGGVVPELASRRHLEALLPALEQALAEAGRAPADVDLIAVTRGPGLVGALMVGVVAAKALALAWDRPLVGVHHLAGHLMANFLRPAAAGPVAPPARVVKPAGPDTAAEAAKPAGPGADAAPWDAGPWPAVCLIVSGGHTDLLRLDADGRVTLLGRTRDDAAGEAFDKVARLLGLSYPGGPAIDRLSREGDPAAVPFPRPMLDSGDLDFSFSGLKTAVAYHLEETRRRGEEPRTADVAASFQQAVVDVLVGKTLRAAAAVGARRVLVGGGVAANSALQRELRARAAERGLEVSIPPPSLCTDNAAMIAAAGLRAYRRGQVDGLELEVVAREELTRV